MINTQMRVYDYYTIGENRDGYGQQIASQEKKGVIKMAIYITNQSIQDNVLYKNCSYVGLTSPNAEVNDAYVIDYNGERLKVMYVSTAGRYKQVFMSKVE